MSEEQNQEITSPAAPNNSELDALKNSIQALEKKNYELIGKLKEAKTIPDGVDVQELLEFKRNVEQNKLESEGKYTEARQALEQQFREASEAKDKRIAELEARVRELELIAPANTALADVVHDPSIVFKADLLKPDQIEREADGTVVVVNGYERKPIGEWAKSLPSYMQKAPKAARQWCACRTQHGQMFLPGKILSPRRATTSQSSHGFIARIGICMKG